MKEKQSYASSGDEISLGIVNSWRSLIGDDFLEVFCVISCWPRGVTTVDVHSSEDEATGICGWIRKYTVCYTNLVRVKLETLEIWYVMCVYMVKFEGTIGR